MRSLAVAALRPLFRRLGYTILSIDRTHGRPVVPGADVVVGSFPPPSQWSATGRPENYCIHDGYRHRPNPAQLDDTSTADQWQLEVYQFAKELSDCEEINVVCDIGCGSGYKLMKYFSERTTIGVDLPQTCTYLRRRWPDRQWLESDLRAVPTFTADLVIASDVIEHLIEPDDLLRFIQRLSPRAIVLSTPDRNLLRCGTHDGPPGNRAHVREWDYAEFRAYIEQFFIVDAHFISYAPQATQCVLCRIRPSNQ